MRQSYKRGWRTSQEFQVARLGILTVKSFFDDLNCCGRDTKMAPLLILWQQADGLPLECPSCWPLGSAPLLTGIPRAHLKTDCATALKLYKFIHTHERILVQGADIVASGKGALW
jgi:hypothetical protein